MAIQFKAGKVNFDASTGRQREPLTVTFPGRTVRSANAALKGFNIEFTNGDHEIVRQEIDIDVIGVVGEAVNLSVDFLLRDSSGNIDDPYKGSVEVLVIADVV